jgi:hypothetical protein
MAQRLLRNIDSRTAIRKANGIDNKVLISCAFPRPNPEAVVQILSKTLVFSRFRGSRRPLGRSWGRQGCCPRGADDLATELPVRCPAGHRRRQGGLGSHPLRPGRQRLSQWPCPAGPPLPGRHHRAPDQGHLRRPVRARGAGPLSRPPPRGAEPSKLCNTSLHNLPWGQHVAPP